MTTDVTYGTILLISKKLSDTDSSEFVGKVNQEQRPRDTRQDPFGEERLA